MEFRLEHITKWLVLFVVMRFLVGCGNGSSSNQTLPATKLALKGPINPVLQSNIDNVGVTSKWISFFGEIINNGETSVCEINILIESTVSSGDTTIGSLSDVQKGFVYGVNLTGRPAQATCLRPREFGAFQVTSHITKGTTVKPDPFLALPSSISWSIEGDNDNIAEPGVPSSDVILTAPLSVGSDLNGNVTVQGRLHNMNRTQRISRPQVSFVALRNDIVIGAFPGFILNVCKQSRTTGGNFISYICLSPGEFVDFSFTLTDVTSDEMTDFYYKIAYEPFKE